MANKQFKDIFPDFTSWNTQVITEINTLESNPIYLNDTDFRYTNQQIFSLMFRHYGPYTHAFTTDAIFVNDMIMKFMDESAKFYVKARQYQSMELDKLNDEFFATYQTSKSKLESNQNNDSENVVSDSVNGTKLNALLDNLPLNSAQRNKLVGIINSNSEAQNAFLNKYELYLIRSNNQVRNYLTEFINSFSSMFIQVWNEDNLFAFHNDDIRFASGELVSAVNYLGLTNLDKINALTTRVNSNSNTLQNMVDTNSNQQIGGNKSFVGKVTVFEPTADNEVATKKYVDDNSGGGGSANILANLPITITKTPQADVIGFNYTNAYQTLNGVYGSKSTQTQLVADVNRHDGAITQNTSDIGDLETKANALEDRIVDNEVDINTNLGKINTNTTNIATNTGAISTLSNDVSANATQINLRVKKTDYVVDKAEIATDIGLKANTTYVNTEIGKVNTEIADIKDQIKTQLNFVGEILAASTYKKNDYGFQGNFWYVALKDNVSGDVSVTTDWKKTNAPSTSVDLSNYYNKTETDTKLALKATLATDNIFAGNNQFNEQIIIDKAANQPNAAMRKTEVETLLNDKANDADVVKITGNQVVAGNKEWTGTQLYKGLMETSGQVTSGTVWKLNRGGKAGHIDWFNGATKIASLGKGSSGNDGMIYETKYQLDIKSTDSNSKVSITGAGGVTIDAGNGKETLIYKIPNTPTHNDQAINRTYPDALAAANLALINTNTTNIALKANEADVVKLTGNQEIAGVKTFTTLPKMKTQITPTNDLDLATKKYVDDNSGGGGTGDVTQAGDNAFTGENSFNKQITINAAATAAQSPIRKSEYDAEVVKLTGNQNIDGEKTLLKKLSIKIGNITDKYIIYTDRNDNVVASMGPTGWETRERGESISLGAPEDIRLSAGDYVRLHATVGITSDKLPRLTTQITPTDDKDFATKKYVDDNSGGGRNIILGTEFDTGIKLGADEKTVWERWVQVGDPYASTVTQVASSGDLIGSGIDRFLGITMGVIRRTHPSYQLHNINAVTNAPDQHASIVYQDGTKISYWFNSSMTLSQFKNNPFFVVLRYTKA